MDGRSCFWVRQMIEPRLYKSKMRGALFVAAVFTYDSRVNSHPGSKKMSDRKYRQRGYMDSDRESHQSKPQSKPREPRDREGPRSPRMMAFGETVKCAA